MDPKEKAFSTLLAVSALLSANSNLRTFNLENGKINSNKVPLTQVDENLTNKFLEDDPVTPTIYSFPEYYYLDKNENTCIQPFELKESIEKEEDLESIDSKYDFSELLFADSNRSGDGQVRLSIIDEGNFEKFFGKKGKYIIRSGGN